MEMATKKVYKDDFSPKCPLDKKDCNAWSINWGRDEVDPANPMRSCRHGHWNSNSEPSPCGKEIFRNKKKKSVKSKRKSKCGCVK